MCATDEFWQEIFIFYFNFIIIISFFWGGVGWGGICPLCTFKKALVITSYSLDTFVY